MPTTEKTAKEITFKEHVAALYGAVPDATSINIEVRVSWSKKLQDYVVATEYYGSPNTLLRLTLRKK